MRQWNIDPRTMCRQHLLGEHVEMHMAAGTLRKGISVKGYIEGRLLDPSTIRVRHDDLVLEMERRGYNHKSPLPSFPVGSLTCVIDEEESMVEICRRCPECRGRQHRMRTRKRYQPFRIKGHNEAGDSHSVTIYAQFWQGAVNKYDMKYKVMGYQVRKP